MRGDRALHVHHRVLDYVGPNPRAGMGRRRRQMPQLWVQAWNQRIRRVPPQDRRYALTSGSRRCGRLAFSPGSNAGAQLCNSYSPASGELHYLNDRHVREHELLLMPDIDLEPHEFGERDRRTGKSKRPMSKRAARNWFLFATAILAFIWWNADELSATTLFGITAMIAFFAGVFAAEWLRDWY